MLSKISTIFFSMCEQFHPIRYDGCHYLSMLELNLNHVSERGPKKIFARGFGICCLCILLYQLLYLRAVRGYHGDVMKWKHFPRYWPFVRGIHRSPVNSSHKGQWRGALIFSLICVWINGRVNNREAGNLRRHRSHYDVIVMMIRTLMIL